MDTTRARTCDYHGSLVALEGTSDVLSTQLRLIPSSSKILILPPLQHFIQEEDTHSAFDARTYILKIHDACKARADMAHSFLHESSPDNKRLLLMNGGTASAQLSCLTAIAQHDANGDMDKAAAIFHELVKNGVAGLKNQINDLSRLGSTSFIQDSAFNVQEDHLLPNDPISRAMRAADALDRQTAFLQPDNDINFTITPRGRSFSVPLRRFTDDWDEAASFSGAGTLADNDEAHCLLDFGPSFTMLKPRSTAVASENGLLAPSREPGVSSCATEAYGARSPQIASAVDTLSPSTVESKTNSSAVVFGRASVVDIRASTINRTAHKKIMSVDRSYTSATRSQDISLCTFSQSLASTSRESDQPAEYILPQIEFSEPQLHETKPHSQIPRPTFVKPAMTPIRRQSPSLTDLSSPVPIPAPCSKVYSQIPRPTFTTPSRPTIRREPPSPLDLRMISRRRRPIFVDTGTNPSRDYVDKGTWIDTCFLDCDEDTEDTDSIQDLELDADIPFETVLPMYEDLVIHFQGETRDTALDSVIQGFKDGTYPVSMPPLFREAVGDSDISGTPTTGNSTPSLAQSLMGELHQPEPTPTSTYRSHDDDYGTYPADDDYVQSGNGWPVKSNLRGHSSAVIAPPTPARTPPPASTISDASFHEVSTANFRTVLGIQNTMRSILNIYFSPDGHYHEFNFPLLPELSSLCSPPEANTGSPRKEKRKIDLILAMGAQQGVGKEFLSAVTASLQKLGTKTNGITRCGRLDLRYLIANAMQAFTAQPLATQSQGNPFSNSLLLATLIIPHLESYMAAHSETRFLLLEYPPEYLTTVLALQQLIGVDLLKVAGIVNSDSNSSGSASGDTSSEVPSSSKDNFIITSSATESEIATLISTVWRILVDISHFYIPDSAARPSTPHRDSKQHSRDESLGGTPLVLYTQEYAPFNRAAVMMGFQTPPMSPSEASTMEEKQPSTPRKPPAVFPVLKQYRSEPSMALAVKRPRAGRTTASQRNKLQKILGEEAAGDVNRATLRLNISGSYIDTDDEDSIFDVEERRYLPLYEQKPEPAREWAGWRTLKWLGII